MGSRRGSPVNGRPTSGRLAICPSEVPGSAKTMLNARASAAAFADASGTLRASRIGAIREAILLSQAPIGLGWAYSFRIDMSDTRQDPSGQPANIDRKSTRLN